MKKCPFCAEEIQDEALKCKHCGERLTQNDPVPETPNPKITDVEVSEEIPVNKDDRNPCPDGDCIGVVENGVCSECGRTPGEIAEGVKKVTRTHQTETIYAPLKEKRKWGWGWLLLLGFLSPAFTKLSPPDSTIAILINLLAVPIVLIFYFWVRTKLIRREKYSEKCWLQSFYAGLLAYCLALILVGISSLLGTLHENYKTEAFFKEFLSQTSRLKDRENQIVQSLIEEPESKDDYDHNLKCIEDYLGLTEEKHVHLSGLVAHLTRIAERKNNKDLLRQADRLRNLTNESYNLQKSYLKQLMAFYSTRDEKLLTAIEGMESRSAILEKDATKTLNNITRYFQKGGSS